MYRDYLWALYLPQCEEHSRWLQMPHASDAAWRRRKCQAVSVWLWMAGFSVTEFAQYSM